jgi:hypothetical protein
MVQELDPRSLKGGLNHAHGVMSAGEYARAFYLHRTNGVGADACSLCEGHLIHRHIKVRIFQEKN